MNFRCCLKAWWLRVFVLGLLVLLLPYLFSRLASNSRRVSIHQRSGQNFLSWQFRYYVVHPSQLSDHRLIYADVTTTTAESR